LIWWLGPKGIKRAGKKKPKLSTVLAPLAQPQRAILSRRPIASDDVKVRCSAQVNFTTQTQRTVSDHFAERDTSSRRTPPPEDSGESHDA
jgi:hypothetical protein